MSTAVQVCSNALVELGGLPINSFDNLSDRALAAANLYPQIRDAVLRSHPWNCATKRVVLSPDSVAPSFGWDYGFTLPGDNLRVLSITERPGDHEAYEIEDGRILCDTNVIYLRYVYRNDNPAKWDSTLTRAMTLAMAAVLAIPVTEDKDKKIEKERELQALLRTARAVDGMETPPESIDDFPLLMARL
jgi:hypothetical protein